MTRLMVVVVVDIYFRRNPKIPDFKVYPFTSLVKSYFLIDSEKREN